MSEPASADAPPPLPADAEGPVFREPWQAQAFAIVMQLYEAGCFTWPEWVATLAAEIKAARANGDPDLGDSYYHHWLAAAETLVQSKQLATRSELLTRRLEVAANIATHVHQARRQPLKIA
jgi:nitrile hydratase accessory protein